MSTKSLRHKFVSAIPDGPTSSVVRSSNWNDDHDLYLGINIQTGLSYTIVDADNQCYIGLQNVAGVAVTLPAAGSGGGTLFKSGWVAYLRNQATGNVTLSSTSLIDGSSSAITIKPNQGLILFSDGGSYRTLAFRTIGSSDISDSTTIGRGILVAADAAAVRALVGSQQDVSVLGKLAFPAVQIASAGANDLDDYEEGTWTPALTFATPGNLAITYSFQAGSYIKIGKSVTITFNMVTSAFTHTTAAGNLTVTGLPFTVQNTSTDRWGGTLQFQGITKAGYTDFICNPTSNATTALVIASASAQPVATVTSADVPTGGTVVLQGSTTFMASA